MSNEIQLTDKQLIFVRTLIETGSREQASIAAGYTGADNSTLAYRALSSPAVNTAVLVETRRRFAALAPVALEVLRKIMCDDTAPKGVRVDAAKAVLDRAGLVAPRHGDQQGPTKALNEMTREELKSFIDASEGELARRAKDVSAPEALTPKPQVTDLLD